MTYVEFFDRTSIENICACLTDAPERVIFLGDNAKLMKRYIENYKKDRQAKLEHMAKRAADRVMKYKRPVSMDPMPAFERRIVHSALQDYTELETSSTGEDPRRYVVIKYKG